MTQERAKSRSMEEAQGDFTKSREVKRAIHIVACFSPFVPGPTSSSQRSSGLGLAVLLLLLSFLGRRGRTVQTDIQHEQVSRTSNAPVLLWTVAIRRILEMLIDDDEETFDFDFAPPRQNLSPMPALPTDPWIQLEPGRLIDSSSTARNTHVDTKALQQQMAGVQHRSISHRFQWPEFAFSVTAPPTPSCLPAVVNERCRIFGKAAHHGHDPGLFVQSAAVQQDGNFSQPPPPSFESTSPPAQWQYRSTSLTFHPNSSSSACLMPKHENPHLSFLSFPSSAASTPASSAPSLTYTNISSGQSIASFAVTPVPLPVESNTNSDDIAGDLSLFRHVDGHQLFSCAPAQRIR